jgi:hypothetical protein
VTFVWRRLAPHEIDHEMLWLAVGGAGLACLALTTAHGVAVRLPGCPFKLLTGLPCPTCGVTRAVMAMTRLDLRAALELNPLAVAAAGAAAIYFLYAAIVLLWRTPRLRPRLTPRDLAVARFVTAGVVSINWLYLVVAGR